MKFLWTTLAGAGILAAAALLLVGYAPGSHAATGLPWPIAISQVPADASSGYRLVLVGTDGSTRTLMTGFADAADPCVSFDGKRILFAGRKSPVDDWDIWEAGADGSDPRRITDGMGDCREPVYLPPAAADPPGFSNRVPWITFVSTAPKGINDQGDGPMTSLYARSLEAVPGRGVVTWRTTYGLGGVADPTVMADGRVLYASRQRGSFALMTISWAGENLNPLYGSHDGMISQREAVELSDRSIVFVETAAPDAVGGRLARVSLRRPLHTHEVLASEGRYRKPHPTPEDGLLVSWRGSDATSFGLYRFDPEQMALGDAVLDDPAYDEIEGVPLTARNVPVGRIPQVEFTSVLDVGELRSMGQLQCLNVYDSDRPEAATVKQGDVHWARFVRGISLAESKVPAAADSAWPPPGVETETLGEVPVEEDGSFYVNVAGDIPFYIELLNARREPVQTMRAWMWVRSGDQRGCVGCHENKELAPENRATQALRRAEPLTLRPTDKVQE